MSDIYSYRTDAFTGGTPADLTGFDVEASDGHIGKVDKANAETGSSSLVVDTGFWIFGKKRLVPAGVVRRVDTDDRKVYLSMTKDDVKSAPDYDEDRYTADPQTHYSEQGTYYERYRPLD